MTFLQTSRQLLAPFSWAYELAMKHRRLSYLYGGKKQHVLGVPVISVGNLSVGGTGKSPMVIWLANTLARLDKKVVVLSRGYKGELEKHRGLLKAGLGPRPSPLKYGDEPSLISRKAPQASVIVGQDRADNFFFYAPEIRPDVVILDDGFQHLNIHRDLDIVLFDAQSLESSWSCLPVGNLRESLSSLRYADVVILTRANLVSDERKTRLWEMIDDFSQRPMRRLEMSYRPHSIYSLNSSQSLSIDELQGKKVIAFAGLASPQSFFRNLSDLGAELIEKKVFADHYRYTASEISELHERSLQQKAYLITTEKDAEKIRRFALYENLYTLAIELDLQKDIEGLHDDLQGLFSLYEKQTLLV